MKRTLVLLLVLALLVCFASCTSKTGKIIHPSNSNPVVDDEPEGNETEAAAQDGDLPTFERVADVFAAIPDANLKRVETASRFVCAFSYKEGVTFRITADIPVETNEKIEAIDFFDDYRDIRVRELIAPLSVKSVERIDDQIPSQEELDRYVGKTLFELLIDGFKMNGYSIGDESVFLNMTKGISEFEIELDGTIEESVYSADDFGEDQLLEIAYAFPAISVTFCDLAFACLDID